jgi:capsular exopolysaccharide synthesis family protein
MAKDERLLPLPTADGLSVPTNDIPSSYAPSYDEDPFGEKQTVRQYLNIVYKRLWLIIMLALVVTSAVAFYMFRQPTVYEASSEVLIEQKKPKNTSKDAVNINFGNDQFYWNTQMKLIQSPAIMQGAIIKLGLQRDSGQAAETANKSILEKLSSSVFGDKAEATKPPTLPTLNQEPVDEAVVDNGMDALSPPEKKRVESLAGSFLGGLKVERLENTNLFAIKIQHTNPDLAPKVAEEVANVFIESEVKRELQSTQKQYDDLVKSVDDLKSTISSQEQERVGYMQSTGLPLFEGKGQSLNADRLQTISQQWLGAIEERRKLEARYEAAVRANSKGEATSLPDIQDSKIYQERVRLNTERKSKLQDQIREIDKQIQEADAERAKDATKYTDEHPKMREWTAKIDLLRETRKNTEKEVSKTIDRDQKDLEKDAVSGALVGLKAQLDTVRSREAESEQAYNREVASANQQGQAESRLMTLTREIETKRNLLDTLTQRLKERELDLNTSRPDNISVSKHAEAAGIVGPQRVRNIFVALLMSLVAGIGLAFLLDYVDDSVKSSDDISRYVGLPTLAMIPHYKGVEKRGKNKLLGETGASANGSLALATLDDNRSALAESYRHLRTSLLFSSAGKPPQVILVTSSQPSEGKTTTALNTAVTLAQAGADVIIIDCDLRRPRLHHHFQLDNTIGITNYLSGDSDVDKLAKRYPRVPNLRVITSGPIPPNPAELLSSNEMRELLQTLRTRYKHVIIDSPPAISFTDAAILSTLADGVIIVAMANKSSLHLIRRFKQRLNNLGARIFGVVINGIKTNSLEYGYYGYGSDYNDYYSAAEDEPRMDAEVDEFIQEAKR